jgi:hypothetical protein
MIAIAMSKPLRSSEADDPYFYDPLNHQYFHDGQEWPGVTSVLVNAEHITKTWYTPDAAERGRRVHACAMAIDIEHDISPPSDIAGEVEAYLRFLHDVKPEYESIEEGWFHSVLRYGGRPDRTCYRLRGFPAVLELKTGSPAPWHRLQLAGYQFLRPSGARWVVYLKPNGRYDLRRHDDAADYAEFLRSLRAWWKGPK